MPPSTAKTLVSDRLDHTLLAVTAHELRHPIHLMRLALERYLPQAQDPARAAIDRYVNQMARLVDDLVDFVRTERDTLDLQLEWLDLQQLLHDLASGYEPAFAQRRVRLSLTSSADAVWLSGDSHRLVQIFSNLLDNALKNTPSGGVVTIECAAIAQSIHVRVRDTGRGIAPALLARIFDPARGDDVTHGLGLGLAIARRIATLHGGALEIFSDGEDQGTEVLITLPALRPEDERRFDV
jgi:signal transduction histidine kinase